MDNSHDLGEPVTELRVAAGDVDLFVRASGGTDEPGPTLVLLHGGPGLSHHYLDPLQDRLCSRALRVVSFDQRGAGASTAPTQERYGMGAYLDDLEALRASLGIGCWLVLGHSWGALVAQAYASSYPQHVRALLLVSSMSPRATDNDAGHALFVKRLHALTESGWVPSPLPPSPGDDCRATTLAMMPAYFGDPETPVPEALLRTGCRISVYRATTRSLRPYDFTRGLRAVRAPCAVFVGERDPFGIACTRAAAHALREASPRVEVFPRVGHFPWLEEPSTIEPLEAFVREVLREEAR